MSAKPEAGARDLLAALCRPGPGDRLLLDWLGHELRNPLAAIHLAVEALQGLRLQDERAARPLAILDRQSERISRVLVDLIETARVLAERSAPPPSTHAAPVPHLPSPVPHLSSMARSPGAPGPTRTFDDDDDGGGREGATKTTLRLVARLATEPAERTEEDLPLAGDATRRRVLVVEDNADFRELLCHMLGSWEYPVAWAADATAALATAWQFEPEIALVDIGLPDRDGCEVASALRRSLGDIHLVAMSGYGQPHDRTRAMDAGFDDYLVKPLAPVLLRRVLEQDGVARANRRPDR